MLQCIQDGKPGLGISPDFNVNQVSIKMPEANVAEFAFAAEQGLDVLLRVEVLEGGEISQNILIRNRKSEMVESRWNVNLSASLNRASYGQLTEGGPIPLPRSHNVLLPGSHERGSITNPKLGAQLAFSFDGLDPSHEVPPGWPSDGREIYDAPLELRIPQHLRLEPHTSQTFTCRFRLLPHLSSFTFPPRTPAESDEHTAREDGPPPSPWLHPTLPTTYILRRNTDYILSNCALPISPSSTCLLTDHVALPLGWNRDNYWQLRLLYVVHAHASILIHPSHAPRYTSAIHAVARNHLTWVFSSAQRPHGYWHRSYLATGTPKDGPVFQLDQQCYPLLELCDFSSYFSTSTDAAFVQHILELDTIPAILALLRSKRDEATRLWPTDESPGDDKVVYPYHFSSHVLLWYTLTRLSALYAQVYAPDHPSARELAALAGSLRDDTLRNFATVHPELGRSLFAYLTDGRGAHTFYHDANDVPTLFASPAHWAFVTSPAELEIWRATLDFGLSADNAQGYCGEGVFPGLGSVHSPGAWVLGYFQEMAYAVVRGDEGGMREAWRKVRGTMQWDGTFGEAVDVWTGECSSKAWFSWPGAMVGALIVEMRARGLEGVVLEVEG